MRSTLFRVLALILTVMLVLTACGGNGANNEPAKDAAEKSDAPDNTASDTDSEPIKDLVYPRLATREIETFNVLYSQNSSDFENLTNLVDPLLEVDTYGKLVPAIAKEWGTEDGGLTWTFKLRDDVKWVDMNGNEKADCNAWDFATGLEWITNFHKNDSNNTTMPVEMIKGAEEYYEYTKTLSPEEANAEEGSRFIETVGIEIPDDYTVIYHCITEKPYFDTVATYACLYPMSQIMVDELGGADKVASMNNENMWYNGAYTMTSYIQGNEKIFTKNPLYWDKECSLFDTVTVKMVESNDVAFQLYQSGDIDYATLTEGVVKTISGNSGNEFHDYMVPDVPSKHSYQVHFNYDKNKEDGTPDTNWNTAVANTAFRKTWYYGLDLKEYYKRLNPVTPMVCENNFYTMKGLIYDSKGTEYTDLVREQMGLPESNDETMARLDKSKFEEYKKQAVEELTALGVVFPIETDYYISASSQTALDSANVLKQAISNSLGDDFIKLNIKTYVSSLRKEVLTPRIHSFGIAGWGADYGDPQNYLVQEIYGNDNAFYSASYSYINNITEETETNKDLLAAYREYTRLVEEADAITTDLDARYEAYAKAEACMLDNVLILPSYYDIGWALSKVDNTSKMNAMFGIQNDKYKNWRTSVNGYTAEQAEAFKAKHDAGK